MESSTTLAASFQLLRSRWAGAALLLISLLASVPAGAAEPVRLRVLSWNVWGLPAVSDHLQARVRALPDAIASFSPDVVVLQELWEAEDGVSVAQGLSRHGYPHAEHLVSTPGGKTGLFIASRTALTHAEFRPFTFGRTPHSLWHLDWLASKGIGRWVVQTPLGGVVIAGTHLQAQYATDSYDAERLSQAVEVLLSNHDTSQRPLILAGDFNSDPGDLPRKALIDLGRVTDVSTAKTPDTIFVGNGRALSLKVLDAREVLTEAHALDDGASMPLSDHAAVLLDVELRRCDGCLAPLRPNDSTRKLALSALETAAADTPSRVVLALLIALAIGVTAFRWRRFALELGLSQNRARAFQLVGFTVLGVCFAWSSYVGVFYYPARGQALRQVAAEFERTR